MQTRRRVAAVISSEGQTVQAVEMGFILAGAVMTPQLVNYSTSSWFTGKERQCKRVYIMLKV